MQINGGALATSLFATRAYGSGKNVSDDTRSTSAEVSKKDDFTKSDSEQTKTGSGDYKKDEKEVAQLLKLQSRDSEVKAHEMAHKSVGGSLAGGMSFEYQTGPDGKQYAVGGEVSIDTSPENDPKATQAKMRQVRTAALAPANPSSQDIKVAGSATVLEMKARMEELKNQQKEVSEYSKQKAVAAYVGNMPTGS